MGPQTTATTVGLFPLAAIPPQTSRDLLVMCTNLMWTDLERICTQTGRRCGDSLSAQQVIGNTNPIQPTDRIL